MESDGGGSSAIARTSEVPNADTGKKWSQYSIVTFFPSACPKGKMAQSTMTYAYSHTHASCPCPCCTGKKDSLCQAPKTYSHAETDSAPAEQFLFSPSAGIKEESSSSTGASAIDSGD